MAAPTIYLVSDMRTVPDSATGGYACITNTTQHQTRNGAEERYHTALAAAARGTNPVMGAMMYTNEGFVLASEHYEHEVQPQPEPEPEGE
jgi:hypothetical protein